MTVAELIKKLEKMPQDVNVWNFNEQMPTPISEVNLFTGGITPGEHVFIL